MKANTIITKLRPAFINLLLVLALATICTLLDNIKLIDNITFFEWLRNVILIDMILSYILSIKKGATN